MTRAEINRFLSTIKPYKGYVTGDVIDMRYFTGRVLGKSDKNFMMVRGGAVTMFCAPIYYSAVKAALPGVKTVLCKSREDMAVSVAGYIKKHKISGLIFDKNKEFFEAGDILRRAGVKPEAAVVSAARTVKTPSEIKLISRACNIAFRAYKYVRPRVKTGVTEKQIALMLEDFMMKEGAEKTSFDTIVAFGKNSAETHHSPGPTRLKARDAVLMDFGCVVGGYCSDITRSWWHGGESPAEYQKIWDTVDRAQRAAFEKIKPGFSAKAADGIARKIIADNGYGDFVHSLGHGVGLNIHEAPSLSPRAGDKDILRENMVFTLEPGIYLTGKYGVRLEETVLLTKTGCKILTK